MVTNLAELRCVAPLFVPGDRPERYAKAAASGADAVIIDLEDAVAPEAKSEARQALHTGFTTLPVFVRVNAVGSRWHSNDLAAVQRLNFAGIVLPKAEFGPHLDGLPAGPVIVALVETARGLADARQLAAHPRISRLAFGSIDYCADLGCAHTRQALLAARTELVLASRLAALPPPLDGVTASLDDLALAEDDARHALELGFGGKLCVHPKQIASVLRGLRPNPEEIAWARKVADAGPGVSTINGTMVDAPGRLRAASILARSSRC